MARRNRKQSRTEQTGESVHTKADLEAVASAAFAAGLKVGAKSALEAADDDLETEDDEDEDDET